VRALAGLHRAADVTVGAVGIDQRLAIAIEDHHPGDTTLFCATETLGYLLAEGHAVGIDLQVDVITSQQTGHSWGLEELLESAAPASPGSAEMDQHLASIKLRLGQCRGELLLGVLGGGLLALEKSVDLFAVVGGPFLEIAGVLVGDHLAIAREHRQEGYAVLLQVGSVLLDDFEVLVEVTDVDLDHLVLVANRAPDGALLEDAVELDAPTAPVSPVDDDDALVVLLRPGEGIGDVKGGIGSLIVDRFGLFLLLGLDGDRWRHQQQGDQGQGPRCQDRTLDHHLPPRARVGVF